MKKRFLTVLLTMSMIAVLGLTGCGKDSKDEENEVQNSTEDQDGAEAPAESGKEKPAASGGKGYVFENDGITIGVDVDMAPIADALGEPKSIFEEPSCAAQGTAYLYTYPGFTVNTYPDGETNLVGYITLKDDTVATPEGIDLSSTREDVIAAYGEDYAEDDKKISYEKDGMTLNFIFSGEDIASIEYVSSVMN